ncbi:MAG: hypothetical protein HY727_16860 [Candidatus Rokubacteria bacterium]|nr:hypothetical protein [Candidatus Rokubacteria bacterium]
MAPPLRRALWVGAAVVAGAAILALALQGQRPEPGFVRFEAAGVMLHIAPERAREVHVTAGDRRWRFTRSGSGGWAAVGAPAAPADAERRLESGLRLLHASAPQRVIARDELERVPAAEYGLDPPRYTVVVYADAAEPFTIQFGAANAQGLAQYARVAGRDELLLLPRFVGEPFQLLTGLR